MTLERLMIVGILGLLMAVCVYFGLLHPIFSHRYRWVGVILASFLFFASLLYIAFIHHTQSPTQNLSPALGILFLLFCSSLLSLLLFGICKLFVPSLLQFQKVWAIGLCLLTSGASLYALFEALQPPKLYTQPLQIDKLSTPLRVLQLSDLHIGGSYLTQSKLIKIINQSNALQPDLIVLTGDIIDAPSQSVLPQIHLLANLKAKYGIFYALGNHEYFYDTKKILEELENAGIKTLVNTSYTLEIDSKSVLNLAGIADLSAQKYQKHYPRKDLIFPDINQTIQTLNPSVPSLLLSHQPKVIDLLPSPSPFSLILSGHTHGGQIFPFNLLVLLQQPFVKGLHQEKDTLLYINQGTAFWGIPMRLGTQCEITLLELQPLIGNH